MKQLQERDIQKYGELPPSTVHHVRRGFKICKSGCLGNVQIE